MGCPESQSLRIIDVAELDAASQNRHQDFTSCFQDIFTCGFVFTEFRVSVVYGVITVAVVMFSLLHKHLETDCISSR